MRRRSSDIEQRRRCKPRQVIFSGSAGKLIPCPACKQRFVGIPFGQGRSLFTLPEHFPSQDVRDRLDRRRAAEEQMLRSLSQARPE